MKTDFVRYPYVMFHQLKPCPMAFSKHSLYRKESQLVGGFARALAYAGRIEILLKLESEGPITVDELAQGHPICMETLSQHLKILRMAHLVIAEEKYPYTFYRVHNANLKKAREAFALFFNQFSFDSM